MARPAARAAAAKPALRRPAQASGDERVAAIAKHHHSYALASAHAMDASSSGDDAAAPARQVQDTAHSLASSSGEEGARAQRQPAPRRGRQDSFASQGYSSGFDEAAESRGRYQRDSLEEEYDHNSEEELRGRKNAAAVTIQSLHRGRQARERVASMRSTDFEERGSLEIDPPRGARLSEFADRPQGGKVEIRGAPAPRGTEGPVGLVSMRDLRAAFAMLDEHRSGILNRAQARAWLRCAGWAIGDGDLDLMLDAQFQIGSMPARRTSWSLPQLLEVLELSQDRDNLSVGALQEAFRTLAQHKHSISRRRLADLLARQGSGFGEAELDQVLALVGLGDEEAIDCEDVSFRILDAVRFPPSAMAQHELAKQVPPRRGPAAVGTPASAKEPLRPGRFGR